MSQHPGPHPDHRSDEAFDRLRAADPAAHLTPDAASLDAAVRSRVGDEVRTGSAPTAAPTTAPPTAPTTAPPTAPTTAPTTAAATGDAAAGDELAAAWARRRPQRWVAVAAVAAGTLAVGSVGYALGDRPDGDLTASSSTSPITLPQAGAGPEATGGLAGPGVGGRAAQESLAADSAEILPWFGGRTVFTAQGLSDDAGTAEAWSYDPTASFSAETAARAAAFLGVEGEPRLEHGAWMVGPLDGSGPNLQVQPDGTTSLSFYDPGRDPFGCAAPVLEDGADAPVEGGAASGTEGGGTDGSEPAVPECTPPDLGDAPQGDAAVAGAREVVAGVGADPDAFEYEVMDAGSPQAVYVTAHSVLGGQRTGLLWSMTLVADGVQSLYGALAPVVPLGTYDVISENAAVERLSDPRFGSVGGPVMAAAEGGGEVAVDPSGTVTSEEAPADLTARPATPPAPVAAGSSFAWPVTDVVLTSARLGLAQHTQPDGATVLLPAYELSSDDGATWSVVAVADTALDFSPVP